MKRMLGLGVLALLVLAPGCGGKSPSSSSEKIVYQSYSDSNSRPGGIYLIGADGKGDTRLSNQPADSAGPKWSPDGRRIAFFALGAKSSSLFLIDSDGKNRRRVLTGAFTDWPAYPAWSPDGKRLVFLRGKPCDTGFCEARLSILTIKTGKVVDVPHTSGVVFAASWSPDGRTIAFCKGLTMWLIRPDGSGARRLTAGGDALPAWSPDGRRIAFTRMFGAKSGIYLIRPDGTGLAPASKESGDFTAPAWSPDSREMAFVLGGVTNGDICVMPLSGKKRCLTRTAKVDDALPDWQPLPAP